MRYSRIVRMTLQLESGTLIANVTEPDLCKIKGEQFAILSIDDNTYMQCAEVDEPGQEDVQFVLEYQDGSLDRHFQVDQPISLDRVLDALAKYLRRDDSWLKDFKWQKMEL